MIFSRKKKIQRDRDAGLVFRWRGGHASNIGGGTLALFLTSVAFAGGFLLLNVYAKPNTVPSRYRASIIQLGEVDDRLAWWIEKNSPPILQWSERSDEESISRVNELLVGEINSRQHQGAGYQDIEIQQVEVDEDVMYSIHSDTLPSIERLQSERESSDEGDVGKLGAVKWGVDISASGALEGRLPEGLSYDGELPQAWRGGSVKFSIAVDAKGNVLVVNPVDWSESEVVRGFENWIYAITFQPLRKPANDASDTVIGVIQLRSFSEVKLMESEENQTERGAQP